MEITLKSARHGGNGFALIITLIFLGVSLLVFGSMMYWVSSNAKVSLRNNQYNMSEAAAEAAVERVLAQMDRDFLAQSLSNDPNGYYALLLPNQANWPVQYTFSDTNSGTNSHTGQISVWLRPSATNLVGLNSQYAGLQGLAQNCTITATATPNNQPYSVPATVAESVQFACIPLFQFAIFYNMDLEFAPGSAMPINGKVFCNNNIYMAGCPGPLIFLTTVQAF